MLAGHSLQMLTKFEVANYKSVKSLQLDMRKFMVLVGPNGAGKTNVVSALRLLGQILARGTSEPARELGWAQVVHRERKPARGGLRLGASFELARPTGRSSTKVQIWIAMTLRGRVGDHEIEVAEEEFELRSDKSVLSLTRKDVAWTHEYGSDPALWSLLLHPSASGRSQVTLSDTKQWFRFFAFDKWKERAPSELKLLNRGLAFAFYGILRECEITRLRLDASALRSDARYEVEGEHRLGPSGEGLPVAVDRLRGRKDPVAPKFRPILDALREVYPRIEDVVPEPFGQGRVTLGFRERGIADPIPLDGISDGVLHALALLVALHDPRPGVLAIEEPENALHPWSVRKILDHAQSSRRQVLITTHSETVVNSVDDPDALFIVEADDQRGTTVEPATSKETALRAILRESGQKLGDVWVSGSLGGVPQP